MKHQRAYLLAAILLLSLPIVTEAQKYAVVNTDYVLKSFPEYASALKRLDKYVADWQSELAEKESEIQNLRAEYEHESYLLPESLKQRRTDELRQKEQELRELQQQRFGPDGDLDKRRAELLGPVQDRVYSTIERIAHEKNYAMVFDKAGSATVLFANKKYDISDDVLELLGCKPGATVEPATDDKNNKSKRPTNGEMRSPGKSGRDIPTPLGVSRGR